MKKYIAIIVIAILLVGVWYTRPFWWQPISVPSHSVEKLQELLGEGTPLPGFGPISVDFKHSFDKSVPPFAGAALIDVDGDGTDEVFVDGGLDQEDALLKYLNGSLNNVIEGTGLSNTEAGTAAMSLDVDNDGDVDLLQVRTSGLHWMRNDEGTFTDVAIAVELEDDTEIFSMAGGDINRDGHVDLYLGTFISQEKFRSATFNDDAVKSANVMLLNNGDMSFTDITESSGLAFRQNTLQPGFVDLDNDGWQDLVLGTNTDTIRIYKNLRNNRFEEMASPSDFGFWMGLGIGDIDNDGDQDLVLSNIGNTLPLSVGRGDLREEQILDPEWVLLENKGDFVFEKVNDARGLNGFEFAWGAVMADMNADGLQDILVAENYVKWPAHKFRKLPGRLLTQGQDGVFWPSEHIALVKNQHFGMTPLISDFNHDGYPDLVWMNINGPIKAYLNRGKNFLYPEQEHHHLVITLPDNARSLGSQLSVTLASGEVLKQQYNPGQGFLSDQSNDLIFVLGESAEPVDVVVTWGDGKTERRNDVPVDVRLVFDQ